MATQTRGMMLFFSSLRSAWRAYFGRLFCKRSIIIISEHETQHVPVAVGAQLLGIVAVLAVVGWASYSSGSYMAAQHVLIEKDKKIASKTEENQRVGAEFALLKRDLTKLVEEEKAGKHGKVGDYAKLVADQYKKDDDLIGKDFAEGLGAEDPTAKYDAVFRRIDFLENKVKTLQEEHDQMVADIREATGGKIAELERVIASTGVPPVALIKKAETKRALEEARKEKYGRIAGGTGGPFIPAKTSMLKEKETDLYFNLKKLMTLHNVVEAMPLSFPLATKQYHKTSSFGTRIDPFRGRLAFHSGVDLSGARGTKIKSTSAGKVVFTGWNGAYGNVVDVAHDYGFVTRYGHLSKILVTKGQTVSRGALLGVQGSTGRSTGNHLHYEVRYNDKPLNPMSFLNAGKHVSTFD